MDVIEPSTHSRLEIKMLIGGMSIIPLDACTVLHHPFLYGTIRVMVEGIHADRSETVPDRIGIPTLPDRRGSLQYRIEPGRIGCLLEKPVSYTVASVL
jgi:hypothetical protein